MGTTVAGVIFVGSLVAALAVAYRFLGDYMYRAITGTDHSRPERWIYRLVGVNPSSEQTWGVYARGVLAFSAVSVLFLYAFQRLQNMLPLSLDSIAVPRAAAGPGGLKERLLPPPPTWMSKCAQEG
jgi:potassium-transporting ATPase potassium-binding subunit